MPSKPQFARMPWFPRDFASATRAWPLVARAVYRELLDAQWDVGGIEPGTLPDDEEQLRELVRATPAEWRLAWRFCEPKFPPVAGGRRNARLEEHRQAAKRDFEARQRGARVTNQKLGRHGIGGHVTNGTLSDTLSDSDSEH